MSHADPLELDAYAVLLAWEPERSLPDWLNGTDLADEPPPSELPPDVPSSEPEAPEMEEVAADASAAPETFVEAVPAALVVSAPEPMADPTAAEPPLLSVRESAETSPAVIAPPPEVDAPFASIDDLARCFELSTVEPVAPATPPTEPTEAVVEGLQAAQDALESLAELSHLIEQVAKSLPSYDGIAGSVEDDEEEELLAADEPWLGQRRRKPLPEELEDARFCLVLEAAGRAFAISLSRVERTGVDPCGVPTVDLGSLLMGRRLSDSRQGLVAIAVSDDQGELHALLVDRNLGPATLTWHAVDESLPETPPQWILATTEQCGRRIGLLDLDTLLALAEESVGSNT